MFEHVLVTDGAGGTMLGGEFSLCQTEDHSTITDKPQSISCTKCWVLGAVRHWLPTVKLSNIRVHVESYACS